MTTALLIYCAIQNNTINPPFPTVCPSMALYKHIMYQYIWKLSTNYLIIQITVSCRPGGHWISCSLSLILLPLLLDMSIFGLYPGHDDFYLVVCSHCGQVVKPQAFEKHCERRHGPLAKLYARLRSPTPAPQTQQRPHHGHSPSHGTNSASVSSWDSRGQGVGQLRATPPSPSTPPQYRHSKNSKDGVR